MQPVATLPLKKRPIKNGNSNDFTYVFSSNSNSAGTMAAATTTSKNLDYLSQVASTERHGNGNDFTYVFGSDNNSADMMMAAAATTSKVDDKKAKRRQRAKERLAKPPSSVTLSSCDEDDRVGTRVLHYHFGIGYEGEITSKHKTLADIWRYTVAFDNEVPFERRGFRVSDLVLAENRKRKGIDSNGDGDSSAAEERPAKQ